MRRSARSTVSAATTASAAAQRAVRVVLLDRTELTVFVEGKARVLDVFQHVCEHLSLRETEYFALAQLVDGEYQFMDENNKLHKIASKGWKNKSIDGERPVLTLYLRVQYYVEHISLLKERCTRQQYYLQLRDNLLHHSQLVSEEKCFLLAAYALQADHGDYSQSKHANSYFDAREYFPAWVVSQHHEDYIQTHLPVMHNDLCGMTRLEAMRHFIKDVSLQPTAHNLHFYKLKKRKTDPIGSAWLAICPRGIEICEETNGFKSPLSAYSWAEISKLHSDKKKFEIRVEGGADRKLTYYTSSEEWGKSLIAFCRRSHIFQLGLQPKLAEIRHLDAQDKRYRETYIYSENQELSWEHNSSCRSRQSLGSASRTSVPGMTGQNGCLAKAGSSASTSNKAGPTSGFDGSQRVSIVSNASSNTTSGIVSDKMHASLDESEDDRSHEILIDCPPAPAAATSFSSLWASTPQSIQGLSPIPSHPPLHRPASRTNSSQSHNSANFVLPTPVLPSSLQQTTPLASSHMQAPPSAPSHMQSPPSASSHMQAPHLAPTQMQALPPASSHMQAPPLTGPVPAEAHLQRMTFAPTMTVSSNPVRPGHPVAGAVSNSVTTDLSVPPAFSTPISHYHAPVQPRQLHEAYETGLQYSFERLQAQLEGGLQYGAQPDSYDVIEQQHETEVVSAMEIMAQLYPSPTPHQPPKSYNNRLQQEYILHQRQLQHQQNQQLQHQQNQQLQHQQNQQLQLQQNQQLQHQQNQQLQHQQNQQLQHQHNQLQHQQNHQLQHQQNQQLQHQQNQQLQHQQNQQLQHQQNQQLQQQMQQQQTPRQDHMLQALQQKLQAELQIQRQKNMQHQLQLQQKLEAVQGMSAGVSHSSILQPTYDNPNLSQSSAMQVERQRALSLHQQQQLQQSTTQRATSIGYTPHMMSSQAPPPQPGAGLQQHPPPYANSVMQFQPQPPPLYQASSILGHSQESLHHQQQQQQQQQHPMLGQNGHMHVSSNSSSNSGLMPTPTTLYNHTHIYENLPAVQNAINASVLHKPLSPQNSGSGRPQTLPVSANNINLTPPLVGSPMSGAVPVLSAQAVRQAQMAERRRRSATVALGNPAHEYQPHQPEVKVTRAKSAATALPSYLKTSTPAELNNNMTKPGLVVRRERPAIPTTPNRHSGGDLVRAASEDTLDSKRRSGHLMSTCPVHSMRTVMDKIRGISSSNNVSLPMLTGLCNDPNLMVNNTCTCSSELGIKDPATKRFSLSSPPVTHFNEPGTSVRPVSWHSEILEQHLRDLSGGDEKSNGYASCGSQLSLPTSLPTPTTSPHSANSTPDAVHTFGSNQQLTDANQPVSGSGPLQKLHKYNGAVPKSSSIHNLMGAYLGVPGNGLSVTVADSRRAKSMVHVNGTLGVVPIHIRVEEKITLTAGRDGGLQNLELHGLIQLRITEENVSRIRINIANNDDKGIQLQTHPNIDKKLFSSNSQLALKNPAKGFPLKQDVGILKWRCQTQDDSFMPLSINCWPSETGQGCDVNIEYELERTDMELNDVLISIPVPSGVGAPVVSECEGEYHHDSRKNMLEWSLPVIDESNKSGAMEFSINGHPDDFFPVTVTFVSKKPYCDIVVLDAVSVDDNAPVKFSSEVIFYVDKYEIV